MNIMLMFAIGLIAIVTVGCSDSLSEGGAKPAANFSSGTKSSTGVVLQEFRCSSSEGGFFKGYEASVRLTNNGQSLNNVVLEVSALAGDKVELDTRRSGPPKDVPNGVSVNFYIKGYYENHSYIKFCNVRVFEKLEPKNMEEALKGKYDELKFNTAAELVLPLPFNQPSSQPFGLAGLGRQEAQATLEAMGTAHCYSFGGCGRPYTPHPKHEEKAHILQTIVAPRASVSSGNATKDDAERAAVTPGASVTVRPPTEGMTPSPTAAQKTPVAVSQDGLVGHWEFETSGEMTLDSSRYANHGFLVPPNRKVWQGKLDGALAFNGTTDYVTVPDTADLRLSNYQTVSTWYQWSGRGANWMRLVGKGDYWNRNYGLWIRPESNMILFQIYDENRNGCEALGRSVIFDSDWHHIAGSYDGVTFRVYSDGQLVQETDCTITPANTDHPVTIGFASGDWEDRDNLPFDGLLDDVRIYNRVLVDCEIASLAGHAC